jgi:2-methylisocitrate lyase-like PEP mutase family enzyme
LASQAERARSFNGLHGGRLLLLPNAWDAASARVFAAEGFPALATTSAGVAWSLGRQDGERLAREEMLGAIRRIVSAVSVPVSADIEAGYGETPAQVAETISMVIQAGAVGVNLEDGLGHRELRQMDEQGERIRAARAAAETAGVPLYINARVDAFLLRIGDAEQCLQVSMERARAYLDAGADGVYLLGLADLSAVRRFLTEVPARLNLMASPQLPALAELEQAGVARVSLATAAMRASLGFLSGLARDLRERGDFTLMQRYAISSADAARLLE